jgi:phosphate transport system substrate-binding protein
MWPLYVLGLIVIVPVLLTFHFDSKVAKIILCVVIFFGFAYFTFLSSVFMLPNYIGANGVWLPFVLSGAVFVIWIFLVFKPFTQKNRRIAMLSIASASVILALIFIAPPLYRSSVLQVGEEINLSKYLPFGDYKYVGGALTHRESSVAKLNAESTLHLVGELPRLDGATALYPLYSSFVRATYPEPEPDNDIYEYRVYGDLRHEDEEYRPLVACTTTPAAYENLIDGYADIVFLMGVSDEQRKMAEERGLELILTPIGREAFVFFVNKRNSAANLSTDDIKRIYSGEAVNWRDIAGANSAIRAYQRENGSGSQTMLRQIMGETPIVPAPMDETFNAMMGMYERVANYRNYRNSLGYSFLYYIKDMIGENKVKFLSIDGIAPTSENIASGDYPFANDFYAITVRSGGEYLNPERAQNIEKMLEWIQSEQGQYLVEATGYVPVS